MVLSPTFGPDVSALGSRSPHGSPRGSPRKKNAPASPLQPAPATSSAPSQANLCVGLVVQPPQVQKAMQSPAGVREGTWRACWALPQSPAGFPQSGTGARAQSVLWLVVVHTAGDSDSVPQQPAQQHAAPGTHASGSVPAAGASSMQPAQQQGGPHQMQQGSAISRTVKPQMQASVGSQQPAVVKAAGSMSLWAIDGLAGVVLGGAFCHGGCWRGSCPQCTSCQAPSKGHAMGTPPWRPQLARSAALALHASGLHLRSMACVPASALHSQLTPVPRFLQRSQCFMQELPVCCAVLGAALTILQCHMVLIQGKRYS